MNTRALGKLRDRKIIALVSKYGCLRTEQIAGALFAGRLVSCRRRLATLSKRGELHRQREAPGGQYVYSTGRIGQVRHRLEVAEVFLAIKRELRPQENFDFWPEYPLCGADRADAFIEWRTAAVTGLAFLEVQRAGYAQLGKYARYLLSGEWRETAWGQAGVFPRVVVAGEVRRPPGRLTVVRLDGSARRAVLG